MIELHGYHLIRPLGRGGMANVYLALQESVQREVALKVMSPTLLGDPEFGERFLREARIAASLRHPNVVQVHDVGQQDGHHFIAMEYLSGGPILTRRSPPPDLAIALRITHEIALALDYAHRHGVVHRDIKPDNILLREDGTPVLTDFGIARASTASRMTRTGAIVGTPHYMSPEQARGQPLDGRADLYSLGVLLHELLLGHVPYQADDSLAIGIMHITAPLPRLPVELATLQPLLDRMLAKEPEQRFQSGRELADVLASTRLDALAAVDTPGLRKTLVTVPDGRSVARSRGNDTGPGEPALGWIEAVAATPPRHREPRRRKRAARRWPWGLAAVLALAVTAGTLLQNRFRDSWPQTDRVAQLEAADRALAAGRLQGDEDGPGATALYRAVSASDPDNQRAHEGLRQVAAAHLQAARDALATARWDDAGRQLDAAAALEAAAADLEPLRQQLRAASVSEDALIEVVDKARAALADGRVDDGEDSAVRLFGRALQLDPRNPVALAGLRDALSLRLQRAQKLMAEGALEEAELQVLGVAAIDPGHLGLPAARSALGEAEARIERQAASLVQQANDLAQQGRLVAPADENARSRYREVLRVDPENEEALTGLRGISQTLLEQAGDALSDMQVDQADRLISEAEATGAPGASISALRQRLDELQARRDSSAPSPAERERVERLLSQARTAIDAGRLLDPPGESAYDLLRAALTLDPANADARDALSSLPAEAGRRFESALTAGRLSTAQEFVDSMQSLAPAHPALKDMRSRLARRLLGRASEWLGAGELRRARLAFDQVRELEPNNPELPAFQARLEQAAGG